MNNQLLTLQTMLTYCRPMGSRAETQFCRRYLVPLGCVRDRHGNWHKTVGGCTRILWSSHTDTVHARQGRQKVCCTDGFLHLPIASRSSCLGADDTAGVFLMTEMIKHQVPGHYVFHYGEERGCVGSSAIAAEAPDWLRQTEIAIALDRRGYDEVITHQGGRTCSDAFAAQLATGLGLGYAPSDRGIYTDTERYAEIVPECTNLAVGYEGAHTPDEQLDGTHVLALLEALCALQTETLTVSRDPQADALLATWEDDLYLDQDYAALKRADAWGRYEDWDRWATVKEAEDDARKTQIQQDLEAWFRGIAKTGSKRLQ